ncbi:MAG TPA: glycosyltransferase family 2 protein [Candidatus Eisenbacteria bacterium]|nr:glycosyltransferase family 2 protein [Candidatus Eisenbacteria bacterium]
MARILTCPIAFNEEKKIGSVVKRFAGIPVKTDLLVIDDASTDGTRRVAESLGAAVLTQPRQSGVGAGIRAAIRHARAQGYDVLVIMAGNDKDRPDEIGRLVRPILEEGCDFVQGSRYLEGGHFGNMPLYRRLATRLHPMLFSLAAGRRITDSTNGFRAMRLSVFDDARIDLDQRWLDQYELEPYVFFKFIRLGYKVKEAPVTKIYPPKEIGYTKMKPVTGWWSILRPIFLLGLGLKK